MNERPRVITINEQKIMGLRPERNNFVPPAPMPKQQEVVQAYPMAVVPYSPTNTTDVSLRTTYLDRSQGFNVAITPVASIAGLLAGIVAIGLFQVPIFSLAVVGWIFSVFCVTWLAGWFWHTIASPDGVALLHTVFGWIFLFREQNHRHRGYDR